MATVTVGYNSGGSALDYTTKAAAYAAASENDTLEFHYSDQYANPIWRDTGIAITAKVVSFSGGLTGRRTIFYTTGNTFLLMDGDPGATAGACTLKNLNIIVHSYGSASGQVYWRPNTNLPGLNIDNCVISGSSYGIRIMSAVEINLTNSIFIYTSYRDLVYCAGSGVTGNITFCTFMFSNRSSLRLANSNIDVRNCLSFGSVDSAFYQAAGGSSSDYNASDDGYAPGLNSRINERYPDIEFITENANDKYPLDWRIATTSSLVGQGVAVAGITTDIDGETRADPPAIGASEGISFGSAGGGGLLGHLGMNGGFNA